MFKSYWTKTSLSWNVSLMVVLLPMQTSEDFIYAITRMFGFFEGVTKIVVPDNLNSAVVKSDRYEPEINRLMEHLGNHYGFVTLPARPGKPKEKSLVENQVKLIYQRVYTPLRKRIFFSLEELNKAVLEQVRLHNRKRMQQRPYSREEHFISDEKKVLKPLPGTSFEVQYDTELTVSANCCIYLGRDKHYYSVPYQHIGQKVKAIYTRTLVKVYLKGERIATHPRIEGFGYSMKEEHLATALGNKACNQGYKVNYFNMQKLLGKLRLARVDGTIVKLITKISKVDLLIIDDFGMKALEGQQQNDFMEIIEDRHGRKATIIASQLPVSKWYDVIGNEVIADAVLDRIVHSSHRFDLKGESLRKKL